jgi:hypothetical protein
MVNDVKLSDIKRPSMPTAKGRLELLRVELQDDPQPIADVKGQRVAKAPAARSSPTARASMP